MSINSVPVEKKERKVEKEVKWKRLKGGMSRLKREVENREKEMANKPNDPGPATTQRDTRTPIRCVYGWTAKGLASSYLGISASFFDTKSATAKHVTLNICYVPHLHTGEVIL